VDLSIQECLAGSLELYGPASALGEPPALRFGNYHRAVWAIYPCADGYAGVFCLERQVPALFAVIGEALGTDVLDEARFRDPGQRAQHDEELSAYVLSFMVDQTGDDLARLGAQHRIPFGRVRTPAELLHSPALRERGFFDTVAGPGGGAVDVPGRPFPGFGWQLADPSPPPGATR
jgi:crotonobetainyl-CoA:carnitine CoA-transferase CaiB-like acyl-CoA transferase